MGQAPGLRFDERDVREALFDAIGEGVYVIDTDGRLEMMNAVAVELLGWTEAELAGQAVHDIIHCRRADGSVAPAAECRLLDVARTGEPVREDDDVFVRRDGSLLPVAFSSYPLRREGTVLGAVVAFRDITAYKEREATERRARMNAEVLARARALPASLAPELGAQTLLDAIVPGLANLAAIHTLSERGTLDLVAASNVGEGHRALLRGLKASLPLHAAPGTDLAAVIATGQPRVLRRVGEGMWRALARDEEHLSGLQGLSGASAILLPLTGQARTFGVLSLLSLDAAYDDETVALAEQVSAQAALLLQNARLFTERTKAIEELQRALLPRALPEVPGLELAARYRPAGRDIEVGGDFYDVFDAGHGHRLLIGDVAGKGAHAAALTGLIRFTVAGAARAGAHTPEVMALANDALRDGPSGQFCTAVYGSLRPTASGLDVSLANAGHPPALLRRRDGTLVELGDHGPVLGIFDRPSWPETAVHLDPGDLLVLYTDGAVELRGHDPSVGEVELRQAVRALGDRSCAKVVEGLEEHVLRLSAGRPRDDLALLALRARAESHKD